MSGLVLRMKIAFVGEPASGKTAFLQMLNSNGVAFPKNYMLTVGADLVVKEFRFDSSSFDSSGTATKNGTTVEIAIFDIGGQEIYRSQAPHYLEGLNGFVVVYDISNKTTFETCKRWVDLCRSSSGKPNLPGFLIANKIDLADLAETTDNQAEIFSKTNNLTFYKASALRGMGITQPLEEMAKAYVENYHERCRELLRFKV